MAWSSTALASGEATALAADRPVLIGYSAVQRAPTLLAEWNTDAGSFAETDRSETDYPAYFMHDKFAHSQSRGGAAITDNEWYALFDASQGSAVVDCVAILNHNLTGLAGIGIDIQRADNSAFSTNLATITTVTPTAARTIVFFSNRFIAGGYLRLRITATGNFVPRIGEVWWGRRRQLRTDVRPGGDIDALSSVLAMSVGSGSESVTTKALGRLSPELEFTPQDDLSTLVDTETVRAWWADCDYGAAPFLWVPNPTSAPNDVRLMSSADLGLSMPRKNFSDRTFKRTWRELPPFLSAE